MIFFIKFLILLNFSLYLSIIDAKPPIGVTTKQWHNIKRQIIQQQSTINDIDDNLIEFGVTPNYSHQAELMASNADFDDHFGEKIATSGNTLIVSAPFEDSNASGINGDQSNNSLSNSGAVYVFVFENNIWAQQAYLKASNPDADDQFGGRVSFIANSLAISGDTIVVGAPLEDSDGSSSMDNSRTDSGAAYVFVRDNGTWTQQAYLKLPNPLSIVKFGAAVAISGDTLAISSDEISGTGAVYIFNRNAGIWTQTVRLEASNPSTSAHFGGDVSIAGDRIVVGSYFEDSIATNSGAAYIFKLINGTWQETALLKASNADENDIFGRSVSISGVTVVVSATGESSSVTGINGNELDNSFNNAGAAYVFVENNGLWSQQAYLKASNTDEGDQFGTAVKISGNTILSSATNDKSLTSEIDGGQGNTTIFSIGAAYAYERTGNNWQQSSYLKPSNVIESFIGLGSSVGFLGDLPVASTQHFNNSTGKVYVYTNTEDLIYKNSFE